MLKDEFSRGTTLIHSLPYGKEPYLPSINGFSR